MTVITLRSMPAAPVPDRVSSRQFKMQLELDQILDQVEAWIASQPKLVQIAYRESRTFDRTDATLLAGFAALNFSAAAVDAFFQKADKL